MDKILQAELEKMGQPQSIKDSNRRLRAFFYGDPGAGKTTLAAHLIENKAAIITADSAWVVLDKHPELSEKIDRYPFTSFAQVRAMAIAHGEGIEPWCTYDTLIWDPVSQAVNLMLRGLVDNRKYPKEQHDPEVEGWPHYRIIERSLIDTVKTLNESDMNIIYTAHIKDPSTADKEKKRFAIRPDLPEASYKAIAREVQLLGWLYKEAKGGQRKIQFEGTLQETAKSQISTIPEKTYQVSEIPDLISKWKSR